MSIYERIAGKQVVNALKESDLPYYNKYGLRQKLIFLTRNNKLVCLDSLRGNTDWKLTMKKNQRIISASVNEENHVDLIFEAEGVTNKVQVSSVTGEYIGTPFKYTGWLANSPQDSIFFKVDFQTGVVGSVRTAQQGFETVWTYNLDQGQEIIDYSYHLKGAENFLKKAMKGSMITIPEEEALYYKIVDPGNLALLIKQTIDNRTSLVLVIINTAFGRVLGSFYNDQVSFTQPIKFIYDDNGIYITYFNTKLNGFELWSVELYKTKIETSFQDMLSKYIFKIKKEDEFDYSRDQAQFVILDKKYGLSFGLKYLSAVSTLQGLTRRNLIGITTANEVVSIDRILVSARRTDEESIKNRKGKLNYYSSVYPPYKYLLQHLPINNLNANWRLSNLSKVKIVETKFESTSLIIAYGSDLFVSKLNPDDTFDLLNEDFNYLMLSIVCVVITIVVIVLRKLVFASEAKKRFYSA